MSLALAFALCLQDGTAEEAFRKIEERIGKAKTVKLKFRLQVDSKEDEAEKREEASGIVLVKEGNRALVELKEASEKGETGVRWVSDGKRVKTLTTFLKESTSEETLPDRLGDRVTAALVRVGAVVLAEPPDGEGEIGKKYGVSDFKVGEDDGGSRTLTYRLAIEGDLADVRLWYDPKTLVLVKRTVSAKTEMGEVRIAETYGEFVLDGEIPDATFRLSEDGKREITKAMIAQLSIALDLFKLEHSRYPERLDDLLARPAYVEATKWPPGGYLKKAARDGWGREFIYRVPGTGGQPYDIVSLGADGREGGEGEAGDLWNHEAHGKK